jgi:hypothetical protein
MFNAIVGGACLHSAAVNIADGKVTFNTWWNLFFGVANVVVAAVYG